MMKSAFLVHVLLSLVTLAVAEPNFLQCNRRLDASPLATAVCSNRDVTTCASAGLSVMTGLPTTSTSLFNFPSCLETNQQVTFQLGNRNVLHASAGDIQGDVCTGTEALRTSDNGLFGVAYTAPSSTGTVTMLVIDSPGNNGVLGGIVIQETSVQVQQACPTPAPVPTPANPTASPVCLAGDMVAQTPAGPKLVEEIKTGDIVATGKDAFEPVLFNGFHRTKDNKRSNGEVQTTYVEIELEHNRKIVLSPAHFALTSEGEVPARNVKLGDIIENDRVLRTRLVSKMGAYNPQTKSRKILVNDIVVSTKTETDPKPEWLLDVALVILSAFYAVVPVPVYAGVVDSLTEYVVEPIYYGDVGGIENCVLVILAGLVLRKLVQKQ